MRKGRLKIKEAHPVVEKLKKIMNDRNLTQKALGNFAGITDSQMSKVFNGSVQLNLWQLSKIAENLQMDIIDIFTYPKKYVDSETIINKYDKVSVTFGISADKREHLLKLVTGGQ